MLNTVKRRSAQVREFATAAAKAAGGILPQSPVLMTDHAKAFIMRMIHDELDELQEAVTMAECFDALEDIKYYIDDCLAKHGVDGDALFDVVHKANMDKLVDGNVILDTDKNSPRYGKIQKPEGWQPPNVEAEIERQINEGL